MPGVGPTSGPGRGGQEKQLLGRACGSPGVAPPLGPRLCDALPGAPELEAAAEGLSAQCAKAATPSPQSLTGHTSPVESVRLNTPEELIVAGSQSGSIRVWDLEAAKSRHSRLSCLPCGTAAVSGSSVQPLPPGSLP